MNNEKKLSQLVTVARMRTDFPGKFGIPRQSGVVKSLKGKIVFEPDFRSRDMLRGLEGFSHIWVLWIFSQNMDGDGQSRWSPTVRPPRLGGNKRVGVFATRSPFRPNPVGLSAVRISRIDYEDSEGPVIYVEGADMADGTPIIDIKPYVTFTDSVTEAVSGFVDEVEYPKLKVEWQTENVSLLTCDVRQNLTAILENDPRPHYHHDSERIYRFEYSDWAVAFSVDGDVLTVTELTKY